MPQDDDPLTQRLNAALDTLDTTMAEVDDLQHKLDQVSSRMDALLHRKVRAPSTDLDASFRSLDSRNEVLRKALDRARRANSAARKGYHAASAAYRDHHQRASAHAEAARAELADAERCKAALQRVLDTLLQNRADRLAPAPDEMPGQTLAGHEGAYRYIPIPAARFFDLVIALERHLALDPEYDHPKLRHRPVSFLDVGCGTGRNLALLRDSDLLQLRSVHGFDIDADQIARGKTLFGLDAELAVGDALDFDYGAADVVFSFRPFQDPEKMAVFEKRLVTTMQTGAYLIAVWPFDLARFADLDCVAPPHDIWKKTR